MLPRAVPRAFEFPALLFYIVLAALSAAICTQVNVRLGLTPHTAMVGVIAAMALGRQFTYFASTERQVLVETATSAGGFAGANISLVGLAILYQMNLTYLTMPLLVGMILGMAADIWFAYRLFDTALYPASGAWPDGEAIGQMILAGDEGGARARRLVEGIAAGVIGGLLGVPMAGVGIAFIGNPAALTALGFGLMARGWSGSLLHIDWEHNFIPHGVMIGAALVQTAQTFFLMRRQAAERALAAPASEARKTEGLSSHLLVFLACAALLAGLARLDRLMPWSQLLLWLAYAAIAAQLHTLIVGYSAMMSGWFPSFAVATAFLLIGLLLRFPPTALALLTGFILSTGPQFADMGYDLKSGWMVRGRGADPEREAAGRFQQFLLQQVGATVGIVLAAAVAGLYFRIGLIPPMSKIFAVTSSMVLTTAHLRVLAWSALFGAALQLVGGPGKALGILFATGLLIVSPWYGAALLAALVVRRIIGTEQMAVRAPGLIAGDGLLHFGEALLRMF